MIYTNSGALPFADTVNWLMEYDFEYGFVDEEALQMQAADSMRAMGATGAGAMGETSGGVRTGETEMAGGAKIYLGDSESARSPLSSQRAFHHSGHGEAALTDRNEGSCGSSSCSTFKDSVKSQIDSDLSSQRKISMNSTSQDDKAVSEASSRSYTIQTDVTESNASREGVAAISELLFQAGEGSPSRQRLAPLSFR